MWRHRVSKLARPGGEVVKRKDIRHHQAVARAQSDDDCPICDAWRGGEKIHSII